MQRLGACALLLAFVALLPAKNLKFIQTVDPFNYELIDVEIDGDLMIVPAGLGGAEIYDISDPRNPTPLGNMELRGCAWDRSYNWDVGGRYAVGTGCDCGFGIFDIIDPNRPLLVKLYDPNDDFDADPLSNRKASMEDVEIVDDVAIFAAHFAGLVFYDISNPGAPKYLNRIRTNNAWSLTVHEGVAYVADGDAGIVSISIKDKKAPFVLGSAATGGTARDIRYNDGLLFVAVGTAGVDVFDVSNPSEPTLLDNFPTGGFTSRVAVHLPYISASSWDRLHVLKWDGARLNLYGYKNTGGRVMAVGSPGGDIVYSAEWEVMRVFQITEIAEPDIDVSTRMLDFGRVEVGTNKTLALDVENNGGSDLHIRDIAFAHDDFTTMTTDLTLPPYSKKTLNVIYTPSGNPVAGSMILFTDDPDEEHIFIRMAGNNGGEVQEGEPAPNFELPIIANGSGTLSLEELRGRVVVLALFASW